MGRQLEFEGPTQPQAAYAGGWWQDPSRSDMGVSENRGYLILGSL